MVLARRFGKTSNGLRPSFFRRRKKEARKAPPVSRRRPHDLGAARPQDPRSGGRSRFFLKMNTVHFLNGKTVFSISETLRRWGRVGKRVVKNKMGDSIKLRHCSTGCRSIREKGGSSGGRCMKKKAKALPQAAACGSEPPHKSGRPGSGLAAPEPGDPAERVPREKRGNFRPDNPGAPGFLKGPSGPLSRAPRGGTAQAKQRNKGCAATAKHRKIALPLQMQGGGAMAVFVTAERRQRSGCCGRVRFCGFVDLLSGAHQGRVSCLLLSPVKEVRLQKKLPSARSVVPKTNLWFPYKILNETSRKAACPPPQRNRPSNKAKKKSKTHPFGGRIPSVSTT